MEFTDKTVLVTGASGNVGRAVARAFREQGANLVLLARSRERMEKAFGEEDQRTLFVAADLLDDSEVHAAVDAAMSRFGHVDVLCNVAGGFDMGPAVHETSDVFWDKLFDLNARCVLHMVRAVVPRMLERGQGKVVNVAANAALRGGAGMGPYCAAKDVVVRLTESMAAELREQNINVNCVLPSIIDTPENRAAMPRADASRWVDPAALADVICFLASERARAIHGAALPVTALV